MQPTHESTTTNYVVIKQIASTDIAAVITTKNQVQDITGSNSHKHLKDCDKAAAVVAKRMRPLSNNGNNNKAWGRLRT